jgi:hypothetical protein
MTSGPRTMSVVTGGGDCPGPNAAIRAVVRAGKRQYGWKVIGVPDAFGGLIQPETCWELTFESTREILPRGTTNSKDPFAYPISENRRMIALRGARTTSAPLAEAIHPVRLVDSQNEVLEAAHAVGIRFGDLA